jgi:hypothetical protein
MYCYEKAPNEMATRIVVDFTIDTKGHVNNATATGGTSKPLRDCIAQTFAKMVFEPWREATKVRYPIHIHTAGQ